MSKHNYNQYSNKNKQNNPNSNNPISQQKKPGRIEPKEVEVKPMVAKTEPKVEIKPTPKPVAAPEVKMVEETVETVALPETVEGTVVNCAKLNVRVAPDITSEVVGVLDAMSEIEINVAKSTDEWFHVCTAIGIEGYCMRKFIEAYL